MEHNDVNRVPLVHDGRSSYCRRPPYAIDRMYIAPDETPLHIIRNLPDGRQLQLHPETNEIIREFAANTGSGVPNHTISSRSRTASCSSPVMTGVSKAFVSCIGVTTWTAWVDIGSPRSSMMPVSRRQMVRSGPPIRSGQSFAIRSTSVVASPTDTPPPSITNAPMAVRFRSRLIRANCPTGNALLSRHVQNPIGGTKIILSLRS